MPHALIALGSNLGDRTAMLARAVERLRDLPHTQLLAASRHYETPAVGGPDEQGAYLNAAVRLQTELEPHALLQAMQEIERDLGRQRGKVWAARTLDLDLLLYDDRVLRTSELIVPHPRLAFRRFVLEPAVEIAAEMRHPTTGWTLGELWQYLTSPALYVAIAGPTGVGKTRLAEQLHARFGGQLLREQVPEAEMAAYYADRAEQGEQIELQFLDQRAAELDPQKYEPGALVVSDYWFEQSLAYARLWLSAEAQQRVTQHCLRLRQSLLRPKLLVELDAPAEELLQRIRARGRASEQHLTLEDLERLRHAIAELVDQEGHGPVLRLNIHQTSPTVEQEVAAAIEAMRA